MESFLSTASGKELVCPRWLAVRDALLRKCASSPIFFVDTESVYDRERQAFVVCELAVRSPAGELLLDTLIDHNLTFGELRRRVKPHLYAKLAQMYDFRDECDRTHGLTPSEIAARLSALGMSPAALVEWSLCGFDLSALWHTFDPSIFPAHPMLAHRLWRSLGLPGSVALMPLFSSVFPDSPLKRDHHRAAIDSQKLHLVVEEALSHFT